MQKKLVFTIGDRVIGFTVSEFDDLDIDKLLRIDYENLVAEILTFPVVVNKLGLLCADMDNLFQESKLDLSIYEAKTKEKIRQDIEEEKGGKRPTIDEIDTQLTLDKIWKLKKKKLYKTQKEKEYMYSIYNAARDKSSKLDKLSLTVRAGDIDDKIIQGQLNNIYFKIKDGIIK